MKISVKKTVKAILAEFFSFLTPMIMLGQQRYWLKRMQCCDDKPRIYGFVWIEPAENVRCGSDVTIGAFVQMWAHAGITIGDNVMIASHVIITTATHDYESDQMNKRVLSKPIVIEDDVWIGAGAMILPGVRLGKGSVIGAGAVITSDVPDFAIMTGVPGRIAKLRSVANRQS